MGAPPPIEHDLSGEYSWIPSSGYRAGDQIPVNEPIFQAWGGHGVPPLQRIVIAGAGVGFVEEFDGVADLELHSF